MPGDGASGRRAGALPAKRSGARLFDLSRRRLLRAAGGLSGTSGLPALASGILPGRKLSIEFLAYNPGRWFFHCHNLWHLATDMAHKAQIG